MKKLHSKRIGKIVGLIVFGVALALIALVLLDRVLGFYLNRIGYFTANTPDLTVRQDTFEFNTISSTNSIGLRNQEVIVPKPDNTFRILALGDSFTFGWGVEEDQSWPYLLQEELQQKTLDGKRIEVINAGKPGVGFTDYRRICMAYKDRLQPDAIIVGMFADDISQAFNREHELQASKLENFINMFWPTLSRLYQRTIDFQRYPGAKSGDVIINSEVQKQNVSQILQGDPRLLLRIPPKFRSDFLNGKVNPGLVLFPLNYPVAILFQGSNMNSAYAALERRLQMLKDRCAGNLPVLVAFIPSPEMVSSDGLVYLKELGYATDGAEKIAKTDFDNPLKRVVSAAGFEFASPLSDFRKDGCSGCYYNYDGHFTPLGQKRFSEFLLPNILSWLQGMHS